MKNLCMFLSGLSFLVLLGSCHSGQQKQNAETDSTLVKMQVQVSDAMAAKMDSVLTAYYQLKDAFVNTDSLGANEAAMNLQNTVNAIPLDKLHGDSSKYKQAHAAIGSLNAEIVSLLGEKTIKGKRQEFQMISDITYDLIKIIGLKDQTVYHEFCPMANNGNGAYWISNSKTIRNPYYGRHMMNCGSVKETLQF